MLQPEAAPMTEGTQAQCQLTANHSCTDIHVHLVMQVVAAG